MPVSIAPPSSPTVDLSAPWVPFKFQGDSVDDDYARELVSRSLFKLEMWRTQNCDPRWRLNEWLYYGYVPPRVWDGTSIPRSSIPWPISFDQVEAANAKLYRELLSSDEILGVFAEGQTHPLEAQQVRDRLCYILDHNIDDEGWTARMELKLCLKDMLIYGNCFALVEWDGIRKQAVVRRKDPRDVWIDAGTAGPHIAQSRATILREPITIEDLEKMRDFRSFKIPPRDQLMWLADNRSYQVSDRNKTAQEAARGVRYEPIFDDFMPMPASRFVDLFIYSGQGREIWMLGRNEAVAPVIYNEPYPYGTNRLVSAPCFTVPNRFYAQSYVDVLDPFQQVGTALINRHLDEVALALNPPRAAKRGVIRTPSQMSWRPGLVNEYDDPKNDQVVFQPQGITMQVWQTLQYIKQEAQSRSGLNELSAGGNPTPSNANRTRGGMQMQMTPPMERLGEISDNFEQFLLVPMLYKMLKIEKLHSKEEGARLYGKRSPTSLPGGLAGNRSASAF